MCEDMFEERLKKIKDDYLRYLLREEVRHIIRNEFDKANELHSDILKELNGSNINNVYIFYKKIRSEYKHFCNHAQLMQYNQCVEQLENIINNKTISHG